MVNIWSFVYNVDKNATTTISCILFKFIEQPILVFGLLNTHSLKRIDYIVVELDFDDNKLRLQFFVLYTV